MLLDMSSNKCSSSCVIIKASAEPQGNYTRQVLKVKYQGQLSQVAKCNQLYHKADVRDVIAYIPYVVRSSVGNFEVLLVWSWTMANDSSILSTASSVLADGVTSNANNTCHGRLS